MLTTTRKSLLLKRLARDGQLLVAPLADELGVSEDTLRRDLRDLARQGKLLRVHGGAVPVSPTHRPIAERRLIRQDEKVRLSRAVVEMIDEGDVVIIDGGTTHCEIAAALPLDRYCTVVTHSPAVAASFEFHENIRIVLIGGSIFRHSMVAMGSETAMAFKRMRADLCLLGVTGVHPDLGLTTGDSEEAALKGMMCSAAAEVVVLATEDKLGHVSPWQIDEIDGLSALISVGNRPGWLPTKVAHIKA